MANENQISMEFVIEEKSIDAAVKTVEQKFKALSNDTNSIFSDARGALDNVFANYKKNAVSAGEDISKSFHFDAKAIFNQLPNVASGVFLIGQAWTAVKFAVDKVAQAIHKGLELSMEAEQIKTIASQFDILSSRAGVASGALKQAFVDAAAGLVDTDTILKSANKAMIELGRNAEDLPKLFNIARQASVLMGGDVTENFNAITQAIATGNTRSLRNMQIIIDADAAYKKFAASIGTTSDKLNQAGRQQAIFEAVLEKSATAFRGIDPDINKVTNSYTALGVQIKELGQNSALAFDRIFGSSLKGITDGLLSAAKRTNEVLEGTFGSAEQKTKFRIETLKEEIKFFEEAIKKPTMNDAFQVDEYKKSLIAAKSELQNLLDVQAAAADDARKAGRSDKGPLPQRVLDAMKGTGAFITPPTPEEIAQRNTAYLQALSQAQDQALALEIQAAQKIKDEKTKNQALDRLDDVRIQQATRDHLTKLAAIQTEFSNKKGFTEAQRNALSEAENLRYVNAVEAIEEESAQRRQAAAVSLATNLKNITVQGLTNAFIQVGENLQKGVGLFDQFGESIVAIVGDIAISLGQALIAQGLALEYFIDALNFLTPGSGLLAAATGASLVIFGAALKASVGRGGSSAPSASGGGGGVASTPEAPNVAGPADTQRERPGTQLTVNIEGSVFDSEETGLRIVEHIQSAFDRQAVTIRNA